MAKLIVNIRSPNSFIIFSDIIFKTAELLEFEGRWLLNAVYDFPLSMMVLLCKDDMSTVTHVTAVKPVSQPPTSDADSSDGEEFCDSFDMSSFRVRMTK